MSRQSFGSLSQVTYPSSGAVVEYASFFFVPEVIYVLEDVWSRFCTKGGSDMDGIKEEKTIERDVIYMMHVRHLPLSIHPFSHTIQLKYTV